MPPVGVVQREDGFKFWLVCVCWVCCDFAWKVLLLNYRVTNIWDCLLRPDYRKLKSCGRCIAGYITFAYRSSLTPHKRKRERKHRFQKLYAQIPCLFLYGELLEPDIFSVKGLMWIQITQRRTPEIAFFGDGNTNKSVWGM